MSDVGKDKVEKVTSKTNKDQKSLRDVELLPEGIDEGGSVGARVQDGAPSA